MPGFVYLAGAGCGGPEWLTLAGRDALRHCDAVLYDELIDPRLLDFAPENAEHIPVGKRAGGGSHKQEDINSLLVETARQGKTVVRLKGGDPFVFGRGGEEALALAKAGIAYTVIPGISSALAIPLEAGIPVTHRAVSRGVHIVTAHTAEDTLPENLEQLARLKGTLVFLMGLGGLEALSRTLIQLGKDPATPAAVLSGGNASHWARVTGVLSDIAARTKTAGVRPPAVILVGEVAGMDLRGPEPVTVGLTGTPEFQEKLGGLLKARGLTPRSMQRAACTALPSAIPWTALAGTPPAWAVFTSQRGVDFFFRRMTAEGVDVRALTCCKFAVIGQATGDALARHGIQADLCPEVFTAQALAASLAETVAKGERVCVFDSAQGSHVIPETLNGKHIPCQRLSLYDTAYETLPQAERHPRYVLFGSAGAVRAMARDGWTPQTGTTSICIGPVSARAFENCFGQAPVTAQAITAEGMVEAVLSHLETDRP